MTLLEQLRTIGLPMKSKIHGNYISWTTDHGKAEAAHSLGARCIRYLSHDPKFSGWEVSCRDEDEPPPEPSSYREVAKLRSVPPWEGA